MQFDSQGLKLRDMLPQHIIQATTLFQLPSAPPSHRVQKMAVMMHPSQIKNRDVPQSSLFPPSNLSLEREKEGVARKSAINYEYYGGTREPVSLPSHPIDAYGRMVLTHTAMGAKLRRT
jgi:hypothetical protein